MVVVWHGLWDIPTVPLEFVHSEEVIGVRGRQIEFIGVPKKDNTFPDIHIDGSCLYTISHTQALSSILQFTYVKEINLKVYGELQFSYSPTPNVYSPRNQSVYLKSKDYNIGHGYNGNGKYELSGMVNKAELSKMDLFPSFYG